MKTLRLTFAALIAALGLLAVVTPANAQHGRWHGGGSGRWHGGVSLQLGIPFPLLWGPSYYYGPPVYYAPPPAYYYAPPPAYYYGPPAAVVPSSPPVYVERDDPAPAAPQAQPPATWWYWCESARGYYPYVKECPGGWQRVPPQQ